jgi:hypothetical protein
MDERVRFVARLLDGEKMAPLCRSFGISRKTGYKIFERYKNIGLEGLTEQKLGITQVDDKLWLATFMTYDLGYFDEVACRLEPIANPFGPKVLPMCPE